MQAERGEAGRTRVLLVAQLGPEERGVVRALAARGVRASAVATAAEAMRSLRSDGADAVVLALPLEGADPVATCAALKEGPHAPVVVLADATDRAAGLAAALPEHARPDAVVGRPLDAAKLAIAIHECLHAQDDAPEEGATRGISLAELLIDLKHRRSSEILELRAAGICTAIHLREGDPIFAEGGSLHETLGRQLVRRGAISHDDYARVVERMTEGMIRHESLRLGEVLVELGLLTAAEVYDALALQVREKIVACFQWEEFAFDLHAPLDESEDLGIYQCPPSEALVLAGIREHYGPERLGPMLAPHAQTFPVLRAGLEEIVPLFQPTPAELKLLRAIDGTHSVTQLWQCGVLDPVHAGQLLCALTASCSLVFHKSAATASAAGVRPKAAGERAAAAPDAAGKNAGGRAAAAPAAEPSAPPPAAVTPAASAPAARGPAAPARAFDPLVQLRRRMGLAVPASPGARDPRQVRLEAETAFNQGLRLFRESALPGALREFRRAVELMPEEPEYRLLEAWLEHRSAHSEERALAAAKVRACAQRALQASRTSARAHSILGQLAQQEGDARAADEHLRLALRYDEHDVDASRALRLVERRKGA